MKKTSNFDNNLRLIFAFRVWKDFAEEWEILKSNFSFKEINRFSKSKKNRQYKKESSYEILEKFKDDPDIYVSYIRAIPDMEGAVGDKRPQMQPRVGINPKSHYNTPLGIYSYPLREVWDKIESENLAAVPYGGHNPYIAILRVNPDTKFIEDMYSDYDSANLDEDQKKLRKFFVPNIFDNNEFDKVLRKAFTTAKERNPVASMWNLTRYFAYIMVEFKRLKKDEMLNQEAREEVLSTVNQIHNLGQLMPDKEPGKLNSYGLMFNRILNGVLGYAGFADKSGKGYIHESEPTQAVFLDPRAYDIVGIIENEQTLDGRRKTPKTLEKIRKVVNSSGESLSDNAWRNILMGYPEFWGKCPDNRDVKWTPEIVAKVDEHFHQMIEKLNPYYLLELSLPKNFNKLPKAKKIYIEKFQEFIKDIPDEFRSENIPELENIPEFVFKENYKLIETIKQKLAEKIIISPIEWKKCPFEDVKNNPDVLNALTAYWADLVKSSPNKFADCPLQKNSKNYKYIKGIAVDIAIDELEKDKRATEWWRGWPEEIKNDPRVLNALKEACKKRLVKNPGYLNRIPWHLKDEGYDEYYNLAKESWMNSLSSREVKDYYKFIPERMKQEKNFMDRIIDLFIERIQVLNEKNSRLLAETIRTLPPEILKNARVEAIAKPIWQDLVMRDPLLRFEAPNIYLDSEKGSAGDTVEHREKEDDEPKNPEELLNGGEDIENELTSSYVSRTVWASSFNDNIILSF